MPSEDRSKYLKIAGIVFAVAVLILLGALMSRCQEGGSPQEQETSPQRGQEDVTHAVPVRPGGSVQLPPPTIRG